MHVLQIFIGGMILGVIVELLMNYLHELILKKPLKIHHSFHLVQRISMVSIPIWGLAALVLYNKPSYIYVFFIAAAIGPFLEMMSGKVFHKLFHIKLWKYRYGAIGTYTSIYAVTYWGGAGILFALIAKLAGI